jgi:predicted transcriptional regulator
MADGLLPFMALLWLGLVALVVARRVDVTWSRYLAVAAAVVAVVGAVASGVQVARIGDSGARAAWHGVAATSGQVSGPHH